MGIDFGQFRVTAATIRRPKRSSFEPKFVVDATVYEMLREVERFDQELGRYELGSDASRRIWRDALARNSFGTASIEGNPLTLQDVESLLRAAPSPETVKLPDEREIINHASLMERLQTLEVPKSVDDVAALHGELFEGVLADAGRFKDRPNFIGRRRDKTVIYVPTTPENVKRELGWALDWLHGSNEHPLVRAIVFFHEFQSIHPFRDGNGRTGRMLSTIVMKIFGYPGVRYALVDYTFNENRDAYYHWLNETDRLGWDYTPWITYMASVLRDTFRDATRRFLFAEHLPDGFNDRQMRVAEWFARMRRENSERRVKFNDVHAAFPQVARRTLQGDLAVLVESGLVGKEGEKKGTTYRLKKDA